MPSVRLHPDAKEARCNAESNAAMRRLSHTFGYALRRKKQAEQGAQARNADGVVTYSEVLRALRNTAMRRLFRITCGNHR